MKPTPLPHIVHPRRIAQSGATINGSLLIAKMNDLCEIVSEHSGLLDIVLSARKDEQHRVFLQGHIQASVQLTCQLCLKPMSHIVDHKFELLVVISDDQAEQVVKKYEPLIVENDTVEIIDLIEQEVLLALPLAPVHQSDNNCQQHHSFIPLNESKLKDDVEKGEAEAPTIQPFTNLKALLSNQKVDK